MEERLALLEAGIELLKRKIALDTSNLLGTANYKMTSLEACPFDIQN